MTTARSTQPSGSPQSPMDIYKFALQERKSKDELKRRDGCEKGWLAVVEAVDAFLSSKGIFIPKGDAAAHVKRADALNDLAEDDPSCGELRDKYFMIQISLHGACFHGGARDSPRYDRDLKVTVREILEFTGYYDDSFEE